MKRMVDKNEFTEEIVDVVKSDINDGEILVRKVIEFGTDDPVEIPENGQSTDLDVSDITWDLLQEENVYIKLYLEDDTSLEMERAVVGDNLITFSKTIGDTAYYCTFSLADSTITGGLFLVELPTSGGTKLYRHDIGMGTYNPGPGTITSNSFLRCSLYSKASHPVTNSSSLISLLSSAICLNIARIKGTYQSGATITFESKNILKATFSSSGGFTIGFTDLYYYDTSNNTLALLNNLYCAFDSNITDDVSEI